MPRIDTDDDPIDYRRVGELSEEFTQLWKRLQAFYLDAIAGFNLIRNHVEKNQEQMRAYLRGSELVLGVIHKIHSPVRMCNTVPWLGGWGPWHNKCVWF
jgi:hypothetical protein